MWFFLIKFRLLGLYQHLNNQHISYQKRVRNGVCVFGGGGERNIRKNVESRADSEISFRVGMGIAADL